MIQIPAFKKKEKEGGEGKLELGGQWKVLNLMALEMNLMLGNLWGSFLLGGQ
jgi:hypothetical protein